MNAWHAHAISSRKLATSASRHNDRTEFPEALKWDTAHLYLYSDNPEHDLRGGLMLRCDLHALFDRWLITIDPDAWATMATALQKRNSGRLMAR